MLYVIMAADNIYQGYHGLIDWSVWDCQNEEEAIEIARENSIEIINSYSCIYEELEETIQNYIDEDDKGMSEEEIDELREEIYQEDISYSIYKIDADIAKEYDIDYLEKMLNRDPEDFIEKYCDY